MFQGVVADQLNVPVRYEAAVEAVLGDRLQSLLATERDQPLAAVEFLRQSTGRCTFLLPDLSLLNQSLYRVPLCLV